jgi:beta-phosphoglucomutase-like phosphatase (HAD superfamily)
MAAHDLVIFDCDGVLVDSEVIAARVESTLLTDAGYPIEPEDIAERFAGMTFKNILLTIERESGLALSASLLDKSERMVDEKLAREVRMITGADLAVAGVAVPRCICSNSSLERIEMMLARTTLKPQFASHIYSSITLDLTPKPAPDIFLAAAKAFDASPARTVVIEDSVAGVTGARAAGMRVIGFTGAGHITAGHGDRLMEAGAETVIAHHRDLGAVLEAFAQWAPID